MLHINIVYHYQTVLFIYKKNKIFSYINPKKTINFYEVASMIVLAGIVKSMMQTGYTSITAILAGPVAAARIVCKLIIFHHAT